MKQFQAFISRELDELSPLRRGLAQLGYSIFDKPLIKVSQIRFTHTPKSDWIFFNSKNAIRYFFAQSPQVSPGVRYAVFGKGSAETLHEFGKKADFIGEGNDPVAIARRFISLLDGDIVLFPQAIDSMQTVQRWLPFHNIARNLFVYKTEQLLVEGIPDADLLIFTSPSNVYAFCAKYKITRKQKVIAIGGTTKLALKSKGISWAEVPASFCEQGLLDLAVDMSRHGGDQPGTFLLNGSSEGRWASGR